MVSASRAPCRASTNRWRCWCGKLPINDVTPAPAVPAAAENVWISRDGWFVIRCVLSRPNCAPIHPHIVSAATEPFQLASFFRPDAPARLIRIALPFDTTPAGLRKFNKTPRSRSATSSAARCSAPRGWALAIW